MSSQGLSQTLARARRRVALLQGLRRAGWVLLAAVLLGEAALAVGVSQGPGLLLATAAVGVAAAAVAVAAARPPSAALAAAVLDARLARGAVVAAAAEALEGRAGRFAPLVLREAEVALAATPLARLLPLRAPTGLLLGAAAAALLPVLLLAGDARAGGGAGAPAPRPPSLLAPQALAGGGDPGAADADAPTAPGDLVLTPTAPAPGRAALPQDPLAAFGPELAAVLRERLRALAREHEVAGGEGGSGATADAEPPGEAEDLERAAAGRDADAALAALEALAAAAGRGDRAARRQVEELLEAPGGAGGGEPASEAGSATAAEPAPDAAAPSEDGLRTGGRRGRLPWSLELTTRRYFAAGGPHR